MARYTFPQQRLMAYATGAGGVLAAANSITVRIYSDSAATSLADIQTTGGGPVVNSQLTIDSSSQIPLFLGPDGAGTLYVQSTAGGAITTLNARQDSVAPLAAGTVTVAPTLAAAGNATVAGTLGVTGAATLGTATAALAHHVGTTPTTVVADFADDGDSQKRLTVDASGLLTWGSGSATGDTNLYRGAANRLQTDDTFRIGASAVLQLGASGDVELYRGGADLLQTDDALTVGSTFSALGSATVGGTLGVTGTTTLGAVTTGALTAGASSNTPRFLASGNNGKKIDSGTKTITTSAAGTITDTITFGGTFAAAPIVVATIEAVTSGTNQVVRVDTITTTNCSVSIAKRDGTNYGVGTEKVHWVAIG